MDAFVITLLGDPYSEACADRCIGSANIPIERWIAWTGEEARQELARRAIEWTWGQGYGNMAHKPYGGDEQRRIACFLSHLDLWTLSAREDREILILEHDAVFVRPFVRFEYEKICQINDPARATPRGDWWHDQMVARGPGVWPKTRIFDDTRPDGLAGGSAYCIKPAGAWELLELVDHVGAWPNDAIICRQFVDGLQELYPFITEVRAEKSTI